MTWETEHHAAEWMVSVTRRLLAIGTIGLMSVSSPLWLGGDDGLQIPIFASLCGVLESVDTGLLIFLVGCLLVMILGPRSSRATRWSTLGMVVSLGSLTLLDQLRLQPWVYHFLWIGILLGFAPNRVGLQGVRWLGASLYLWSAWSKCDPLFVESHGQMLLDGVLKSLDISAVFWPKVVRNVLVWGMPVGEFLVGFWLLCRRWQLSGLAASVVMHSLLIAALSSRGLNHGWTVIGWNLFLICQNLWLFRGDAGPSRLGAVSPRLVDDESLGWMQFGELDGVARCLLMIPLLCPALNYWGLWDHWPSWSLYSSRPGLVELSVRGDAVNKLPGEVREFVLPAEPLSEWRRVRLEEWCFQVRGVPPVPQVRWKLALAAAMTAQPSVSPEGKSDENVRVIVRERAGLWRRDYVTTENIGITKLKETLTQFWLNTSVRRS
ncbi:MAG: hypothetical protein R3C01_16270 [Planctomycetaceae bacterium]